MPLWSKSPGGWYVLGCSGVSVVGPADTSEDTLATIPLTGGAMGANGALRITTFWSRTNNANVITLKAKLGATALLSYGTASIDSFIDQRMAINRNAQNSQMIHVGVGTGGWGSSSPPTTASIDTSAATNITITVQKATAGDTVTLHGYLVEVFYQV